MYMYNNLYISFLSFIYDPMNFANQHRFCLIIGVLKIFFVVLFSRVQKFILLMQISLCSNYRYKNGLGTTKTGTIMNYFHYLHPFY